MIDNLIVSEWLFDHHQVKLVERLQSIHIVKSVCGVGIRHELDLWKAGTDLTDNVDVPTRLDLHFDALIACRKLGFDLGEKLIDRVLDPDGDAAGDFLSGSGSNCFPQRLFTQASLEVPNSRLDASARHVVSADMRGSRADLGCVFEAKMQDARSNIIDQ